MIKFPDDVFTEPSDVDPDTLANLGPLRRLAGSWEARTGVDLNPKADGPERREFLEHITSSPSIPKRTGRSSSTAFATTSTSPPPRRTSPFTTR